MRTSSQFLKKLTKNKMEIQDQVLVNKNKVNSIKTGKQQLQIPIYITILENYRQKKRKSNKETSEMQLLNKNA